MADPDIWNELAQQTAELKRRRLAAERIVADPAAELARRYAQHAGVFADVLELMAEHRPDILYRFLDEFHEHDRSARVVIDAIEATLKDEVEWEEFLGSHPELGERSGEAAN